jgi:hypothetical protein
MGLVISIVFVLLGAGLGYYLSSQHLFWVVPRRKGRVPSIVTALTGSAFVGWGGIVLFHAQFVKTTEESEVTGVIAVLLCVVAFILGFTGTVLALYAAVKIGTPGHATVTVICNGFGIPNDGSQIIDGARDGRIRTWMQNRGINYSNPPPTVWPETFWVAQEGSVSWILYGAMGTDVTIQFDKGYDPFSINSSQPSVFHGTIAAPVGTGQPLGLIVAGPVVRAGRGGYRIITKSGGVVRQIDPDGGSPTRKG